MCAPGLLALTELQFPAETTAVREGLARLMASPCLQGLGAEDRGTAEVVLAEALNNVVEHAYARWSGDVLVTLRREPTQVEVRITDHGLPMPQASPPQGALPEIGAFDDLPEGGFGWFLIRSLARELTYRRQGERNELTFAIPVDNWEA